MHGDQLVVALRIGDDRRMLQIVEMLSLLIASWLNRQQQRAIAYLREENRYLRAQLGDAPLRFTDRDRRRLGERGHVLGRRVLDELALVAHPDTILRWYRELIAAKYAGQPGRPATATSTRDLIVQMARENSSWGYSRIRGALLELGVRVGRSTIQRVLRDEGIDPAPGRKTTWSTFIASHAGAMAAMDFFTVEVLTLAGLVRKHVLFVLDVGTRRVQIAGITEEPNARWVELRARELSSGFLRGMRYLIHDRSPVFTERFRQILGGAGIEAIKLPAMSPNLNAFAERWVRSVRSECLDRVVILGEAHLQHLLSEYMIHYNHERSHQGLGNRVPAKLPANDEPSTGAIVRRQRLGGLLSYYHRRPA
jgi:transposase InsO family protein